MPCENIIQELKHDFALGCINQQSFDATETTLNFMVIAINLVILFKQVMVKDKIRPTLKALRYNSLGIGSYIAKNEEIGYLNGFKHKTTKLDYPALGKCWRIESPSINILKEGNWFLMDIGGQFHLIRKAAAQMVQPLFY